MPGDAERSIAQTAGLMCSILTIEEAPQVLLDRDPKSGTVDPVKLLITVLARERAINRCRYLPRNKVRQ